MRSIATGKWPLSIAILNRLRQCKIDCAALGRYSGDLSGQRLFVTARVPLSNHRQQGTRI
jgi:hypothetical protein